eukprot:CAMPEP_0181484540 /NCGR_PEP_ID=MMETSP1110-20121109/46052_1 /TAXON_ID=174948 /ORGANISM="Symbiodinium sp., Strain CCMP421" /LENGTH=32 /DNA_ID= /DNA_START= /DNA_END= /DNA_ORIENTATION=
MEPSKATEDHGQATTGRMYMGSVSNAADASGA